MVPRFGAARLRSEFRPSSHTIVPRFGAAHLRSEFRTSSHRVDDEVHRELGVVLRPKALVLPRVVPLAPIVLIRADDAYPSVAVHAAQIAVHDVVAPTIELVRRLRRTVEL